MIKIMGKILTTFKNNFQKPARVNRNKKTQF